MAGSLRDCFTEEFDDGSKPKIIIFGVGGIGLNSVEYMIRSKISFVKQSCYACADTDKSELIKSNASYKIVLGDEIISGFVTNKPIEFGYNAALKSIKEIRDVIGDAEMVFVAAGLGGSTGSGAAPVIAQVAKEQGALTVGVVTIPLSSERSSCLQIAKAGVEKLKAIVDCLITIPNETSIAICC